MVRMTKMCAKMHENRHPFYWHKERNPPITLRKKECPHHNATGAKQITVQGHQASGFKKWSKEKTEEPAEPGYSFFLKNALGSLLPVWPKMMG